MTIEEDKKESIKEFVRELVENQDRLGAEKQIKKWKIPSSKFPSKSKQKKNWILKVSVWLKLLMMYK
jgi:hypothetical protein